MKFVSLKVLATVLLSVLLIGCAGSPQARRDKYVARGDNYLKKQDYTRAILEFKNALRAKPDDATVLYKIGEAYLASGDYSMAAGAFQKTISVDPKNRDARLKLAQLLSWSSDPADVKNAKASLLQMLGQETTPEELNTLAFTDLKLGDPESAVQSLQRALVLSPGELSSAVMLARAKLLQNDPKGAEAVLVKLCADVPRSADPPRLLAEFYVERSRLPEAEAQLRKALAINSKSAPALMDLARLLLTVGRTQEAEQIFKVLSHFDGYKSTYATFLYQQGRRDEAIREFTRLFQADPDDRSARTHLVQAYRLSGQPLEAEKILAQALHKNPHDADALLQRAEVEMQKRDFAQAELDVNRVMQLRPAAPEVHYVMARLNLASGKPLTYREELGKALELNPALLPVRLELAQSLINEHQGQAALDMLDGAPQFQKDSLAVLVQRNWALWSMRDMTDMRKGINQGLTEQRSSELLIQDGLWKLQAGDPTGARASLQEALRLDPADLRALSALRQTYLVQKNAPLALQKVKEYAATQPKSAPVQEFLGMMLMASGDRQGARTAFVTAKAANPDFVDAKLSLVQIDVAEGKVNEAKEMLQAVLAHDGSNLTAARWLGNLEEMKGDHADAISHFQQVVAADPRDPQASNNLAYLLAEYGNQTDDALKLAQRAVELAPTKAAYCDTLGWVLYKKGLYSNAIPYLERASADAGNIVWKYHLAMAYAKAGEAQKGKATLEAALKVNPRVPEAQIAKGVVEGH